MKGQKLSAGVLARQDLADRRPFSPEVEAATTDAAWRYLMDRLYGRPQPMTPLQKSLKPHQERVVAEKHELDEKLGKLEAFFLGPVYPTLSIEEKSRLQRQSLYMRAYSGVLNERICAFD